MQIAYIIITIKECVTSKLAFLARHSKQGGSSMKTAAGFYLSEGVDFFLPFPYNDRGRYGHTVLVGMTCNPENFLSMIFED